MKKDDRPVAKHVLATLEQNKGFGLREADIVRQVRKNGWMHMQYAVEYNLKYLVKKAKIIYADPYFGIPVVREDGTAFLKIWNTNEIIELGKLKSDGQS
jgi:hypothetical protein